MACEMCLQGCVCSVAQVCPALCHPMNSLPGSSVHGIPRQEDLGTGMGCHFLLRGIVPHLGIKPASPESPALAGGFFTTAVKYKICTLTLQELNVHANKMAINE